MYCFFGFTHQRWVCLARLNPIESQEPKQNLGLREDSPVLNILVMLNVEMAEIMCHVPLPQTA